MTPKEKKPHAVPKFHCRTHSNMFKCPFKEWTQAVNIKETDRKTSNAFIVDVIKCQKRLDKDFLPTSLLDFKKRIYLPADLRNLLCEGKGEKEVTATYATGFGTALRTLLALIRAKLHFVNNKVEQVPNF